MKTRNILQIIWFILLKLHTILTVPMFSITSYIPEVVDGVFKALDDPAPAVRDAAASVLSELLQKLNAVDENNEVFAFL